MIAQDITNKWKAIGTAGSLCILLYLHGCNLQLGKTTGEQSLEIDNDTLNVKLDLSRGGTISYISTSGSKYILGVSSLASMCNASMFYFFEIFALSV